MSGVSVVLASTSGTAPAPVDVPGACYHPNGLIYYYGGAQGASPPWSTQFFSYNPLTFVWTSISTVHNPGALADFTMGYDPVSGKIIGFGGWDGSVSNAKTWQIDPTAGTPDWTQLTPAASPLLRSEHSMFTHPTNGQLCIYGGNNNNSTWYDDLWTWTGTNWSELSSALTGTGRTAQQMTTMGSIVLLFGGKTGAGSVYMNDTWTWDGTTATQQSPANVPAVRGYAGFGYSPNAQQVLMHGGINSGPNLTDLWTWNGSNWTLVTPVGTTLHPLTDQRIIWHPGLGQLVEAFGYDNTLGGKTNEVYYLNFVNAGILAVLGA